MSVTLRRATAGDIDFIMATERQPGFERLVGRSPRAAHEAALTTPGCVTLLGSPATAPAGFAMLQGTDDAHGNVYIRRIAVARPGAGFGRPFVAALTDWVFRETAAHRLWLTAFVHNARARHVYAAAGFVEEGVQRQAFRLDDGTRCDLVQLSLLRPP